MQQALASNIEHVLQAGPLTVQRGEHILTLGGLNALAAKARARARSPSFSLVRPQAISLGMAARVPHLCLSGRTRRRSSSLYAIDPHHTRLNERPDLSVR